MQPQWRRRHEEKVRVRPLSATTIARARPTILAELARRASRPRWANVPAREFMQALVREDVP
jgi:hypothetical protein